MNTLPYYIYLDSKIVGSAKQITTFFENQIFSRENTTILIKEYKHKSTKQIARIFRQFNLPYRFVLMNDIDDLDLGIVFYPFNAQSNCRVVANRRLLHIFITHGESNKAASIKPIIRIYDHVFTAGQAGIERFLAYGIFSQHDIDTGRIVIAGDTFIGKTGLSGQGKKCIFYAPTWESSIEQENYSSLQYWTHLVERILLKQAEYQIDTVLIRPHPNIGHRLQHYHNHILALAKTLRQNGKGNIFLYQPNLSLSWWQIWQWKRAGVQFIQDLGDFQAAFAFCDVSAMETQLLNENIPYELFYPAYQSTMAIPNLNAYHEVAKIGEEMAWLAVNDIEQYKAYLIDARFEQVASSNRIHFLLNQLSQNARNKE